MLVAQDCGAIQILETAAQEGCIRASQRCGNQCFTNATFTALAGSSEFRKAFWKICSTGSRVCLPQPGSSEASADAWQNLCDIAHADGPERDARLRVTVDRKHGNHEQRLAVTLAESMRLPLTKALVPRLPWHRFYNWDLANGLVEKGAGKHESTQEDAQELLVEVLDGDAGKSPALCDLVESSIVPVYVCRKRDCHQKYFSSQATERSTVVSVDLIIDDASAQGQASQISSVQSALDNLGDVVSDFQQCRFQYNGQNWACSRCHSEENPRKGFEVQTSPRCLCVCISNVGARVMLQMKASVYASLPTEPQ